MKSFWTFCAARELIARSGLCLLLALLLASPAEPGKLKLPAPEDVTNLFLSPEHSRWLVGPISQIVEEQEIGTYLALRSDEEAVRFIDDFWARRGPEAIWPKKGVRQLFDERALEADKLFTEAVYRGHQTDRGTVYVLYGPPEESRFEVADKRGAPPVEIWTYAKKSEAGLDGRRPARRYRFAKKGNLTVFYTGMVLERPVGNPG